MTTCGVRDARYEPDWARIPPVVSTYPNPPAYFRKTPANTYTSLEGKDSYQKWWSKWHTEQPDWRDEHYRLDRRFPVMRREHFYQGVTVPPHRPVGHLPPFYTEYVDCRQVPAGEVQRAYALNRIHWARADPNLYPYCNAMTGTQYQKPVPGVYGPMKRTEVYGVKTLHNRHGFMPAVDYYF